MKDFDREMEVFSNQLFEFPISFPPSYPYEEDADGGCLYMQTRCPAWCDRVLLSETAKRLVHNVSIIFIYAVSRVSVEVSDSLRFVCDMQQVHVVLSGQSPFCILSCRKVNFLNV